MPSTEGDAPAIGASQGASSGYVVIRKHGLELSSRQE